jgi:hypothetical protein
MMRRAAVATALAASLSASTASAHDVESAVAHYDDDTLTAWILSLAGSEQASLWKGEGRATSFKLGATGKSVRFKQAGDLLERQLDGDDTIEEQSMTASVDQGVGVGASVGALAGQTKSPLSKSRYFGARASYWWLDETLQTTLEARRTFLEQSPLDFIDTDGHRVQTPEDLAGSNVGLTVTHLTTPSTILRSSASRTTREDRPAAWSLGLEIRQFVTPADAAVHFAVTHYENLGKVTQATSYGTIVAENARLEWHQHVVSRLIVMGGYRYYLETEKPRAADAAINRIGADAIYGTLRWRFGDGPWTADAPEVYSFVERYKSNVPNEGVLVGVGGRLPL